MLKLDFKLCTKKYGTGLKTISPKQMLQRLTITLTHVQAGNNSENYDLILKLT